MSAMMMMMMMMMIRGIAMEENELQKLDLFVRKGCETSRKIIHTVNRQNLENLN